VLSLSPNLSKAILGKKCYAIWPGVIKKRRRELRKPLGLKSLYGLRWVLKDPNIRCSTHQYSIQNQRKAQSFKSTSRAGNMWPAPVPMANNSGRMVGDCSREPSERASYMMMETVVYSREFLFVQGDVWEGELGKSSFFPELLINRKNGLMARILGRPPPPKNNALCNALCKVGFGFDKGSSRIYFLLWPGRIDENLIPK